MKSLIMILANTTAGTFHPILYLESPMPGETQPGKTTRYKSKFHHTTGFLTRDEATQDVKDNLAPKVAEYFALYDTPQLDFDNAPEWDGNGIPASVIIYDSVNSAVILG